jgi:hypothetical protein
MNGALNLHPKVVGGTGGGTLGILVVWLLGLAHVTVDPVVAGALVTVLAFVGGYLAPVFHALQGELVSLSTRLEPRVAPETTTTTMTKTQPTPTK